MSLRPYRVLHADLPFYSDPQCKAPVEGARLLVLQCEDSHQEQRTTDCLPSRKHYESGQMVSWNLNNKAMWESAWYRNPDTGEIHKAWSQSVEFVGNILEVAQPDAGMSHS